MSRGRGGDEEAVGLRPQAVEGLTPTPLNVLAVASYVVESNGRWIKYDPDSYHQQNSSAWQVRELLTDSEFKPDPEDYEKAIAAVNWLAEVEDNSEYIGKLREVTTNTVVPENQIGFFASAIAAYARSLERPLVNEFTGVPKNKYGEPEAKVISVRCFDTTYGDMWVYKFRDPVGRHLVVRTSRLFEIKPGDIIRVVGTIKEHKVNSHGDKETILTRAKIVKQ